MTVLRKTISGHEERQEQGKVLREGRSLVISICFVEHMGIYLFLSCELLVLTFEGVPDLIILLANNAICTL